MSRALLIRSIPLSSATSNAWRTSGAHFARRSRNMRAVQEIADDRPIINLGNSAFDDEGIWNRASVVSPLLNPASTRMGMGSLLPPKRYVEGTHYWLKAAGRGGVGKEKVFVTNYQQYRDLQARAQWIKGDIQQHIDGQEYRVITVGNKVVQVSARYGANGDRSYAWVGVSEAPVRVKAIARQAAAMLQSNMTIIGWDVILTEEKAYILEGNSCPGVNQATANRILNAVEGIQYDG